MSIDITIKIGGEAGQGIQTVGELLALVCKRAGLYVMAINDFESRIRGGHSFHQIRISDHPVCAPHHKVHLLVALDQKTFDLHKDEMEEGGVVILEKKSANSQQPAASSQQPTANSQQPTANSQQPAASSQQLLQVPIADLAEKAGGKIMANTVAAGASLSLLGVPFELFQEVLSEHFSSKKEEVAEKNITAAKFGYESVKDASFQWAFQWKPDQAKGAFIDGSRAIALGALAADCRMAAFYPMSPATGIMTHLSSFSDNFPVVVEQVEDEIAAVNMIIGASFAGVRAMTSTSGGGFCLMTEGLGLAAITETPIVIVNAQRPGPATGLPTRTAQGDLQFVIWASQDEFPRFVFAPGTPSEAFEAAIRAFHLAEKYQVPVIILSDQYLNDSTFTAEKPLKVPEQIERFITSDGGEGYERYALTPDGVSPRVLPCSGKSLVITCGNEHREDGHTSEDSLDRVNMVNKRNAKIPNMLKEMNPPKAYYGDSETLVVGWGSSQGAIQEGVDLLRAKGMDVGSLIYTDIYPFPAEETTRALGNKRFFVAEANSAAQFARLIRQETGLNPSGTILKYNGRPFFPVDIVRGVDR